jgi:hypothetical protein
MRENESDDFHIEKVTCKQVENLLFSESRWYHEIGDFIIVTNDDDFLRKHLITINIDELKMLCELEYDSRKIRINALHDFGYNEKIFYYLEKILGNKITSASMDWVCERFYFQDMDEYIYGDQYHGWKENLNFYYKKNGKKLL